MIAWFNHHPALGHMILALLAQAVVALPLAAATRSPVWALAFGAALASGYYIGRERKQIEYDKRDRAVSPLSITWRAAREAGYPAFATAVMVVIAAAGGVW